MRRLFFASFILVLFICCSNKQTSGCKIDAVFAEEFANCINIVLLRQTAHKISNNDIYKAYYSLELITGIESNVMTGTDSPFFYNDSSYNLLKKDVFKWSKWYEENKCNITIEDVQNIFAKNTESLPNYNDPKVREKIKLRMVDSSSDYIKRDSILRIELRPSFPEKFTKIVLQEN